MVIGFLNEYECTINAKIDTKIDALQQIAVPIETHGQAQVSEQIKRLKTFNTIPAHLHSVFPSNLEFNMDPTPVEQEVNPSHMRIKRVEFKR